jgi:uncharacterized membrane protein
MDKTQRIIVILLVLAILFSAISVLVSYSALNFRSPQEESGVSGQVTNTGSSGISLYVEEPPERGSDG